MANAREVNMKTCRKCGEELILVGGYDEIEGDYAVSVENCKHCGQEYKSRAYIAPSSWSEPEMVEGES
jgi:hypothetical protein